MAQYLAGKSDPSRRALIAIADATGVRVGWLAVGEEPKEQQPVSAVKTEDYDDYTYIPLFRQEVSAGHGAFPHDKPPRERLAFLQEWIKSRGLDTNSLFLLPVAGESMEPTLSQGDVVLVDKSVDHVCADGLYVLRLDSHLYIKRLQRLPGGAITVISDNPAYKEFYIGPETSDDVAIIGRVVWIGKEV
jgi:phage repressor protein C with HTH and peptisase S24 domain